MNESAILTRLDRLEAENKRWRRLALWLAAALAALIVAAPVGDSHSTLAAPQAAAASSSPDAVASVEARRRLAQDALDMIRISWRIGAPISNQPSDIYNWSRILLGSQIYLGMAEGEPRVEDPDVYLALPDVRTQPERLDAFEAHARRMRQWEDRLRPLARSRIMAPLAFKEIEAHRHQAEMWLARERTRLERQKPAPARQ
jgi:hypothetical protein